MQQLISFAWDISFVLFLFLATAPTVATTIASASSRMTNDCSAFLIPSQVAIAGGASAASRRGTSSSPLTIDDRRLALVNNGHEAKENSSGWSKKAVQTTGRSTRTRGRKGSAIAMLAPSQALRSGLGGDTFLHAAEGNNAESADIATVSSKESLAGDGVVFSPAHDVNGHGDKVPKAATAAAAVTDGNNPAASTNSTKGSRRTRQKHRMTGNIPDVYWRAVPLEHLRHHPRFEPLPHPDTVKELKSLEDVRLFRQESWQWDALHSGRCTTSQATAALGLLDPEAGSVLGIPRSLQKGAVGAYHRLRKPALRSLDDMNEVLCTGEGNSPPDLETLDYPVWDSKRTTRFRGTTSFAALYLPRIKRTDLDRRRQRLKDYYLDDSSRWLARMQWGNAQEPTAILTALNYFSRAVPGTIIREVGMCGAGLDINSTSSGSEGSGLIVGATPDAVIHYPNGTLEALEVKNHCPFVPLYWGSRRKGGSKGKAEDLFRIRESRMEMEVPPAYVPQLMLEMLSLGPQCRSAIMVRQTATKGAVILRLQRDDDWINEMMYWLNQFMETFVNSEVPPPPNVFWEDGEYSGGERYRAFVNRTKEISERAEHVTTVPHKEIQRVVATRSFQIPLFLD
mmetsp:Transcript_28/g.60  ORF Transcript_28/g.60 Transcript_28/m.60 type:complete len:624 (+) Transcript_28:197-2068(+)